MKRWVGSVLLFLIVAGLVAFGVEQETLDQLIARANAASPSQQPTVKFADEAHAMVLKSGKKLPHTEIKIRRMAAHLRDLKQNVDADEQAGVQSAVDKLEAFRTDLLKAMFGSKNPEKK